MGQQFEYSMLETPQADYFFIDSNDGSIFSMVGFNAFQKTIYEMEITVMDRLLPSFTNASRTSVQVFMVPNLNRIVLESSIFPHQLHERMNDFLQVMRQELLLYVQLERILPHVNQQDSILRGSSIYIYAIDQSQGKGILVNSLELVRS